MARVVLLAVFLLSGSFPARAQDTRTDQAGSVLREYVDKGYCTYTYVVPPGSRTEGCTPPGLDRQLAETKEETARLKNQVDRLSSLLETLMSQQSDLTSRVDSLSAELSEEKVRSAQLEQNLTQELQEVETRLQDQCTCERAEPDGVISSTTASLPRERTATTRSLIPPPATEYTGPVTGIQIRLVGGSTPDWYRVEASLLLQPPCPVSGREQLSPVSRCPLPSPG
ncbi:uncharacterized protein LOC144866587 [Branchiostoma floridae x Branchiostoma japonicum]